MEQEVFFLVSETISDAGHYLAYLGIRHADHVALSIRKSWQSLRRQAAVAR
jgi:hypothetical protein